ncbi:MAG: (Fe-S)-binding protein [Actinobacteria bacterium]|nr:MAG: (Fe-S)-binding protein [Actinomycetota bacterium]
MVQQTYKDLLYKCNKCGFCLESCPTYKQTLDETYSARGLLTLAEAVESSELELTDVFRDRINSCIRCLACADKCPSGLLPFRLIQKAKENLVTEKGMDMSKRVFCRSIVKNKWLMGRALKWGKTFGFLEGSVPKMAHNFQRLVPQVMEVEKPKANVGFFVGCAINLWYPQIGLASVRLLTEAGFNVTIPKKQKCCGVPVLSLGDAQAAKRLAADNLEAFEDVEVIVTACASCGLMLKKDYKRFGAGNAFMNKVKDVTEFLAENIGDLRLKSKKNKSGKKKKITYHDPCHLNRGQDINKAPRKLLNSINGLELVEVKNSEECCGGGGTFRLFNQELAVKIAQGKINAARESKATVLSTSCPGCIMQFNDIFEQTGEGMPVKHVVELLADSLN